MKVHELNSIMPQPILFPIPIPGHPGEPVHDTLNFIINTQRYLRWFY